MSPITNFPDGLSSWGMPVFGGGDLMGIAMGRGRGIINDTVETKVIFVDSAVAAGGKADGSTWSDAYDTIQEGVNAARYSSGTTIDYNDTRQCFVIVAPGNYAEQVAFSAKNVHLIGLGIPGTDNGVAIEPASPSTYWFAFSGNGCEIANFAMNLDTAVYGMYLPPAESCWIHDNVLHGNGTGTYGMYFGGTGLKGTRVYNNIIDSFVTCGIYAATDATAYAIQGGIFRNIVGGTSVKGIDIDITTCYAFMVWQNWITGTSSASIECSSTGVLVADNWCDRAPSGTLTARDNHYSSAGA